MSAADQCQKPLPVGASGSNIVTAKLFVPLGAPDQASAGDMFSPLQSQPLKTCSLAILPPGLISGLVRDIALAAPPLASPPAIAAVT
jgi:hypothetical protein